MKSTAFTAGLLATTALCTPLRIISYNIRQAVVIPTIGERPWADRRPLLTTQLSYETSNRPESLLCMQEVLRQQLVDVLGGTEGTWAHVGVGRDDGRDGGEFSPILYRPDTWELDANRTYWLSETPDVPGSKGWDAAYPRVVTAARLRHRQTGGRVVLLCTHFDHMGQVARERSADMIVDLAGEWESDDGGASKSPVFVAGDLNSDDQNQAYKTLATAMRDSRDLVPEQRLHGNTNTYTAFTALLTWDDKRLDHVFVKDPSVGGLRFDGYSVLSNRFDDGIFISDHREFLFFFLFFGLFCFRSLSGPTLDCGVEANALVDRACGFGR